MTVPIWFEILSDFASIAGLLISGIVWFQVRSLKKSFILRARLPEIVKALEDISSDILKSLQMASGHPPDTHAHIEKLKAILGNLLQKVNRPDREITKKVFKKCNRRHDQLGSSRTQLRDHVWEIYNETQGLIESLKQTAQDTKWS